MIDGIPKNTVIINPNEQKEQAKQRAQDEVQK